MDTHVTAFSTIQSETATPPARLPGEPGVVSRHAERVGAEEAGAPEAVSSIDTGDRPTISSPPKSRRRQRLLVGAAVVALAAGGVSGFLISPYNRVFPVPQMVSAVRQAASSAGIQIPPGMVAPSAKLAAIAMPQRVAIVHAPYTPAPVAQDMHELLALHAGGAATDPPAPQTPTASGLPAKPDAARNDPPRLLAAQSAPGVHPVQTAPGPVVDRSGLDAPPPGYVPTEPGSPAPLPSPTAAPRAEPAATPPPRPEVAATPPATATDPGIPAATPASLPAQHDLAQDVVATLHPVVAAPSRDKLLSAATDPTINPGAPAEPAKASLQTPQPPATDAVVVARELHPGPMTPKDQVAVLGMVTELATLVGDLRSEANEIRNDLRKSGADNAAHLGDLERRMAMVEARDALSTARSAAPLPPAPAPVPVETPAAPPINAVPVRLTRAEAALPPAAPGTLTRYKVQAASPGLAMLAQIDRSGGDGAQIEVRVGDSIPGYGRVKSIGQKGSTWVVTTEHGDIS